MIELRCEGTLHGRMVDETHIEVKCNRRKCGHEPGVVVLHVINIETGILESTQLYADPRKERGKVYNGASESSASVRAS